MNFETAGSDCAFTILFIKSIGAHHEPAVIGK